MFANEVSSNLLLSDAATWVDYDDESVCITMNGNGFVLRFYGPSTQWGHVEQGQFT